ncbi:MAG: thiamine-phosphate kinase [Candidatus Diapherotrites archaeon]|nr:thiamine-phosphate kinase [Candidatus Diapherotrites archaeon]
MRLSGIGERAIVAKLRKMLRRDRHVLTKYEEDAEIIGNMAVTVDMSVVGNHFQTTDPNAIGHKVVVSTMSDLLAKGALPQYMFTCVGIPSNYDESFVISLYKSMDKKLKQFNAYLLGGDTIESKQLVVASTAIGKIKNKPLLRSNAKPGDSVVLTGNIGSAALGYRILTMGLPRKKEFIEPQLKPELNVKLCKKLMEKANAGIDISDGLGFELNVLAKQSKVRIDIDRVPVDPKLYRYCRRYGLNADDIIWHSGEDYQIVYTIPGYNGKYKIGEVSKGRGVYYKGKKVSAKGWENFSS